MQVPITRGVEARHFISKSIGSEPAPAEVWDWMTTHARRFRSVPSPELFARRWPTFVLLDPPDSLDAVLEQFVQVVNRRESIEQIRFLSRAVDDWGMIPDIAEHFFASARTLARNLPTSTVTKFSESPSRMELHRLRQQEGRAPGVSFFFPRSTTSPTASSATSSPSSRASSASVSRPWRSL
jgi:hypothetical protein